MMELMFEEPDVASLLPVVDGYFLPEAPSKLMKKHHFNTADLMVGYNADEGTMWPAYFNPNSTERPHINITEFEKYMIFSQATKAWAKQPLIRDAVELTYIDDSMTTDSDPDYFDAAVSITGDFNFACPSQRYLGDVTEAEVGQVYAYYFNHHPSRSIFTYSWTGACHGDDLFFFGIHFLPNEWNLAEDEVEMTMTMIKYWTNFAKTG